MFTKEKVKHKEKQENCSGQFRVHTNTLQNLAGQKIKRTSTQILQVKDTTSSIKIFVKKKIIGLNTLKADVNMLKHNLKPKRYSD